MSARILHELSRSKLSEFTIIKDSICFFWLTVDNSYLVYSAVSSYVTQKAMPRKFSSFWIILKKSSKSSSLFILVLTIILSRKPNAPFLLKQRELRTFLTLSLNESIQMQSSYFDSPFRLRPQLLMCSLRLKKSSTNCNASSLRSRFIPRLSYSS